MSALEERFQRFKSNRWSVNSKANSQRRSWYRSFIVAVPVSGVKLERRRIRLISAVALSAWPVIKYASARNNNISAKRMIGKLTRTVGQSPLALTAPSPTGSEYLNASMYLLIMKPASRSEVDQNLRVSPKNGNSWLYSKIERTKRSLPLPSFAISS